MFYWWINHPLKQFLPFAVQRGRALWRSNTSLATAATLSWQPPAFGTGSHASAFAAGELLSCGREKSQSQELCWSLRDSRLPAARIKLFFSFFSPNCTDTSSSDLGPPWLFPSWAHFTHHPPSSLFIWRTIYPCPSIPSPWCFSCLLHPPVLLQPWPQVCVLIPSLTWITLFFFQVLFLKSITEALH